MEFSYLFFDSDKLSFQITVLDNRKEYEVEIDLSDLLNHLIDNPELLPATSIISFDDDFTVIEKTNTLGTLLTWELETFMSLIKADIEFLLKDYIEASDIIPSEDWREELRRDYYESVL